MARMGKKRFRQVGTNKESFLTLGGGEKEGKTVEPRSDGVWNGSARNGKIKCICPAESVVKVV